MNHRNLAGLRVLIVEDEPLVAKFLEELVAQLGCVVAAVASNVDEATEKLSSTEFGMAILDLNLNGARAFRIAEALARKQVPFVFATAYGRGGVPQGWPRVPVLAKPFGKHQLRWALSSALEAHRTTLERGA